MEFTNTFPLGALQLLADGSGESGSAVAASGGTSGDTAGAAARQSSGEATGAQAPCADAPAAGVQRDITDKTDAEFEALIRGPYKRAFDERMQRTISRRLKQNREELARYQAMAPTLERLARKYGVEQTDAEGLCRALDAAAEPEPAPEEVIRQGADRLADQWRQQERQLRECYPGFDLAAELDDGRFRELLRGGMDLQSAYELCHRQEHLTAAMAYAVSAARRRFVRQLSAQGLRPSENGMGGQAGAVSRRDVSRFTGSDIDAIRRRVEKGERISFG